MKTNAEMYSEATNTTLKEWYTKTYPTDDLGEELNEHATFYDLFEALEFHNDIYYKFNINDSIVRERLFEKLSNIIECDYDYIYNQWLN